MPSALKPRDVASDDEEGTEEEEEFHSGEDDEGSVVSTDGEDEESADAAETTTSKAPGAPTEAAGDEGVPPAEAENDEGENADSDDGAGETSDAGDGEEGSGTDDEAGQGADAAAQEEQAPRKPLEPYDVPKSGAFFMHDDRGGGQQRGAPRKAKGKLWEEESGGKWLHDRFGKVDLGDDEGEDHFLQGGRGRGRGRGKGQGRGRGRGRGGRGGGHRDDDNEPHSIEVGVDASRGRGRGRGRGQGRAATKVLVVARSGEALQLSGSDPDDPPPGFEGYGAARGQGRKDARQPARARKSRAPAVHGDSASGLNAQAADYNPAAKVPASVLQNPQAAYAKPFIPAAAQTAGFAPDAAAFYPSQMAMPHMMYPGDANMQGYIPTTMSFMPMHMGMSQADVDPSTVPYMQQYNSAVTMSQAMAMAMTPEQMASMMTMMDPTMLQGMQQAPAGMGQNATKSGKSSRRYSTISGST